LRSGGSFLFCVGFLGDEEEYPRLEEPCERREDRTGTMAGIAQYLVEEAQNPGGDPRLLALSVEME